MGLDNNDIKALIAILQKGLTDDDAVTPAKKPRTKRGISSKSNTKPKHINNFENMPEFKMCKEDLEFDRKVKKPQPSVRNRDFDYVKVQCRVCGKKDKVAPGLVESIERYKCNKCSTGAG